MGTYGRLVKEHLKARVMEDEPSRDWVKDIVHPLAKALVRYFPDRECEVSEPVRLPGWRGRRVQIRFTVRDTDKSQVNNSLSLTFESGDLYDRNRTRTLYLRDYSRNIGKYPEGSIGEVIGLNFVSDSIPRDASERWFVEYLVASAKPDAEQPLTVLAQNEALRKAVYANSLIDAERAVKAGALLDVSFPDPGNYTPLVYAAEADKSDLAKELLLLGAKIDEPGENIFGYTPLQMAAEQGHAEFVKLLLAAGADPNARGAIMDTTALMEAARHGHVEVVKALLEAGADPYAETPEHGETAVTFAYEWLLDPANEDTGQTEVIKLIGAQGRVVYSASESEFNEEPSFWNSHQGWVSFPAASILPDTTGGLPLPEDSRWMPFEEAREMFERFRQQSGEAESPSM